MDIDLFWYWYYCGNLEEGFKIKVSHYNLICPFLNLNYELSIVHWEACILYILYMCQSVFPCIDWIWSDCCHRQEHRSWLHIKNSADLHRTSCAVLDMKDDRYPITSLYVECVADGKYCPRSVTMRGWSPDHQAWSGLNTLLAWHQVWAGFLNTWVTLHSQQPSQLHLIFTTMRW